MQDYRTYLDQNHFYNLFYSSCLLCIPTLYTIYLNKLDHLFLVGGTCLTSMLRWGYPANIIFQNIDHNFVKLVFITNFIYIYKSINKHNKDYIYFLCGCLLNILFFYGLATFAFHYKNDLNIIFHMMVHLYTLFGFIISSHFYKSYCKIY